VTRGYLGVSIVRSLQNWLQQFKVPDTSGALVEDVSKGGPADKGRPEAGDVIRKFDGRTVNGSDELLAMVANTNPGSPVTLDILRNVSPRPCMRLSKQRPAELAYTAAARKAPAEGRSVVGRSKYHASDSKTEPVVPPWNVGLPLTFMASSFPM